MSKNNTINNTPGLTRVVPNVELPVGLATKVTGRNFAAVSYIVSLEAERRGVPLAATAYFSDNGSLSGVTVSEPLGGADTVDLPFGSYLVLGPDDEQAVVLDEDSFQSWFAVLR